MSSFRSHVGGAFVMLAVCVGATVDAMAADVLVVAQTKSEYDGPTLAIRQSETIAVKNGKVITERADSSQTVAAQINTHKPAAVVVLRSVEGDDVKGTVATANAARHQTVVDTFNGVADLEVAKMSIIELPAEDPAVLAAKAHGAEVTIVTVSATKNPLSLQSRVMRHVVRNTLASQGMIDAAVSPDLLLAKKDGLLNVGVYDGGGSARSPGPNSFTKILSPMPGVQFTPIGPAEIQDGNLAAQLDVLLVPGGSGSGQAKAMGAAGTQNIRSFIENGGGYVSTCAGTYLATNGYDWSLKVINLNTLDRKHWKRGKGDVQIEFTEDGKKLIGGADGLVTVLYANGPLLGPAESPDLPGFKTLAYFRSDMAKNGAPSGIMPNTPAIVAGEFGKGRVICFSPHPEYTDGLGYLIERAVLWSAQK